MSSTQYQGFVNVTGIVDAAGAGTYTTANVQLGTGKSDSSSGGWALVVAYGDPAAPSRNLSVFDGMQSVGGNGTVTIRLSGFQTPPTGPVNSTVGVVAYEGDFGTLRRRGGDPGRVWGIHRAVECRQPGTTGDAASNSNVFNSTISNAGALMTLTQAKLSGTTWATTRICSGLERARQRPDQHAGQVVDQRRCLQPGVVTIVTDLYAPRITATKTVDPATADLGDR